MTNREMKRPSWVSQKAWEESMAPTQPKECPCCEANAEVIDNQIVGGSIVLCTNGKCSLRTGLFLTRGMALAAWNKRQEVRSDPAKAMTIIVQGGDFQVIGNPPDGPTEYAFALICHPVFKDGKVVALDFSDIDYAIQVHERGDQKIVSGISRSAADRDRTPNWPNPEPA